VEQSSSGPCSGGAPEGLCCLGDPVVEEAVASALDSSPSGDAPGHTCGSVALDQCESPPLTCPWPGKDGVLSVPTPARAHHTAMQAGAPGTAATGTTELAPLLGPGADGLLSPPWPPRPPSPSQEIAPSPDEAAVTPKGFGLAAEGATGGSEMLQRPSEEVAESATAADFGGIATSRSDEGLQGDVATVPLGDVAAAASRQEDLPEEQEQEVDKLDVLLHEPEKELLPLDVADLGSALVYAGAPLPAWPPGPVAVACAGDPGCRQPRSSRTTVERRRSRSGSSRGHRATPREYVVEVITPQKVHELTGGMLPADSPPTGQHVGGGGGVAASSPPCSPTLLLCPGRESRQGPEEDDSSLPGNESSISLSSDEGDIKGRMFQALQLERADWPPHAAWGGDGNGGGGHCAPAAAAPSTSQVAGVYCPSTPRASGSAVGLGSTRRTPTPASASTLPVVVLPHGGPSPRPRCLELESAAARQVQSASYSPRTGLFTTQPWPARTAVAVGAQSASSLGPGRISSTAAIAGAVAAPQFLSAQQAWKPSVVRTSTPLASSCGGPLTPRRQQIAPVVSRVTLGGRLT